MAAICVTLALFSLVNVAYYLLAGILLRISSLKCLFIKKYIDMAEEKRSAQENEFEE